MPDRAFEKGAMMRIVCPSTFGLDICEILKVAIAKDKVSFFSLRSKGVQRQAATGHLQACGLSLSAAGWRIESTLRMPQYKPPQSRLTPYSWRCKRFLRR